MLQVFDRPQKFVSESDESSPLNITFSNFLQSSKIVSTTPLEVSIKTSDGTVILIKEEQPEKHPQPKASTDDGTMMLTKEEQPEKQYSLNPNTDDGIVMFAKEEQPEKQPYS